MFDTLKKYKGTLAGLFILAGGYYAFVFLSPTEVKEVVFTNESAYAGGSMVGAEIVAILNEINSIKLNTEIFEDETFNKFEDLRAEIAPEPKGRKNPFDPIGFGINLSGVIAEPINIEENLFIDDVQ
jgi:hypothetical protein